MKTILLNQGMAVFVDDADYEYLMQWKWSFHRRGSTGYAKRIEYGSTGKQRISMHRLVAERAGMDVSGVDVDHVDGNGLNNTRANLRIATRSQNNANGKRPKDNTTGFKGVYPRSYDGKPVAQIGVAGRRIYLGTFDDPCEAAKAYNEAALEHFGEYAQLNPV